MISGGNVNKVQRVFNGRTKEIQRDVSYSTNLHQAPLRLDSYPVRNVAMKNLEQNIAMENINQPHQLPIQNANVEDIHKRQKAGFGTVK